MRWPWGIDPLALLPVAHQVWRISAAREHLVGRELLGMYKTVDRWPLDWAEEIASGQRLANVFYKRPNYRLYNLCYNYSTLSL